MPDATRAGTNRPGRAQTRRRVLDAAFRVFGEFGISGASLAQVAAAAGLTKGAVYSNFRSKDELVLALMEEHATAQLTDVLAQLGKASGPGEVLADAPALMDEAMRADAAWHRIMAEYFALSHRNPDRREGLRRRRRAALDAVTSGIVDIADRTGLQPRLPAADLAAVLFALGNGLAVESAIDPAAVPDDLFGRVLTLLVTHPG